MKLFSIIHAMRPKQWTKNAIVLAPLLFALGDETQIIGIHSFKLALATMLTFCLASSAIYLINDIRDLELDREHPTKKTRPLAAGKISILTAAITAILLLVASLAASYKIGSPVVKIIGGYLVLQFCYTFGLKKIALLDLFIIATGFVLRALAGALAIHVDISPWLLLCTLFLALFLALCKRRHEKVVIDDDEGITRPSLRNYDEKLLDQLIAIISATTLVCYALYTLSAETVVKFGTNRLGFTIPFVIFGLFRYLDLVYRHEKGGRPEQILLTDLPLLADVVLYGVTVWIILTHPSL